jgi:hypothetical protein
VELPLGPASDHGLGTSFTPTEFASTHGSAATKNKTSRRKFFGALAVFRQKKSKRKEKLY